MSITSGDGGFDPKAAIESASASSEETGLIQLLNPLYLSMLTVLVTLGSWIEPVYHLFTIQRIDLSLIMIILSGIVLYILYYYFINGIDRKTKALLVFCGSYFILWWVLSSGIIWYGIAGIALLPLLIAISFNIKKSHVIWKDPLIKYLGIAVISIWFILIVPFRLVPTQMTLVPDISILNFNQIYEPPFIKYATFEASGDEVVSLIQGPQKSDIIKLLNRDLDAKIMSTSGTFLNYFIIDNDKRMYSDNMLDNFNSLWERADGDKDRINERIKSAGFKYIVVGLSAPAIDQTPGKTLQGKFRNLLKYFFENDQLRLIATDQIVQRPDGDKEIVVNGQRVRIKNDLFGNSLIKYGTIALFEVL